MKDSSGYAGLSHRRRQEQLSFAVVVGFALASSESSDERK